MSTLRVDALSSTDDAYLVPVKDLLNKSSSISSSIINLGTEADRTLADWKGEVISVKDYGAKGDGVSDDTQAFQKAFNKVAAGGYFELKIPAGRYILSDKISLTNTAASKVSIIGAGSESTVLDWGSTNSGLFFLSNDSGDWWMDVSGSTPLGLHLSGFSLVNRKLITNVGVEIQLNSITGRPTMGVTFDDIVWRGYDTFDQGWAKCCRLKDTPNVKFNRCRWFQGGPTATPNTSIGVDIVGTSGGDPSEFYFDQCESFYGATWITAGSNVEGIRLTNCTHIGSRTMVWQAVAESGLIVVGGHFNDSVANFYLDGVFDITISGANLYNEGHGSNSHTGITILNGGRYDIGSSVFVSSTDPSATGKTIAVLVANSAGGEPYGGGIDNNTFHNYTDCAVVFGGGAAYNTAGPGNVYRNCTNKVADTNTTVANFIKRSSYSASADFTFSNGGTSQSFTISIPAGLLSSKPDVVHASPYDFAYLVAYDFNSSTATSLVFNVRNASATAIPAGTSLKIGFSIPCL